MLFHHIPQLDAMDCGAACLRMIAQHYGKRYSAEQMRRYTSVTREGVSMLGISDAAEHIGILTDYRVKYLVLVCLRLIRHKQNR